MLVEAKNNGKIGQNHLQFYDVIKDCHSDLEKIEQFKAPNKSKYSLCESKGKLETIQALMNSYVIAEKGLSEHERIFQMINTQN